MQCKRYANSWYTVLLREQWHVHYRCNCISYLWSNLHMWYLNMQRDGCTNLNYCSFIYNKILRHFKNCLQTAEVGGTGSDLMVLVHRHQVPQPYSHNHTSIDLSSSHHMERLQDVSFIMGSPHTLQWTVEAPSPWGWTEEHRIQTPACGVFSRNVLSVVQFLPQ